MSEKRRKLTYHFIERNTPVTIASEVLKISFEANKLKIEEAVNANAANKDTK